MKTLDMHYPMIQFLIMAITWQLPVLFDISFAFQMDKRGFLQDVFFLDLEP